jgi:hypothetical protein
MHRISDMEGGVHCITTVDESGQAFGEKITTVIEPQLRLGSVLCNLYFIRGTECLPNLNHNSGLEK